MMTIRHILKKYGVKKDESLSTRIYKQYYKTGKYATLNVALRYKKDKCVDATWTLWLNNSDRAITDDILFELSYMRVVGKNCVNDIKYVIMTKEEKK